MESRSPRTGEVIVIDSPHGRPVHVRVIRTMPDRPAPEGSIWLYGLVLDPVGAVVGRLTALIRLTDVGWPSESQPSDS